MSAAGNAPAKEAPLSPDGSELTAWFLKKGESFLSRPFRRFFVLDLEQVLPAIVYFTDETRKDEKGTIPVGTLTGVETSGESCLSLVTKDRTFELESESIEVRTAWVAALTRFIDDETPDRERSCESRSSEGVYGMVCPECKDLFSTEDALMAHYDNAHSDTVRIARASSISSRTESSSEVPVWSEQPLGVARKLWSDFATARSELGGGGRHAHPVILTRLQTLLYKKPATTSEKKFEKTVVAWVADDSAKKCKDCGAAFSSGLLKNLFDQAALSRHHCRLCGLLVCDQCFFAVPLGKSASLLSMFQARQELQNDMHCGVKSGVVSEEDESDESDDETTGKEQASDAERRLAIIEKYSSPPKPRRDEPVQSCKVCENLVSELYLEGDAWIKFMDARLLDRVFPLPISAMRKDLVGRLELLRLLGAELCEIVTRFYRGEAFSKYEYAKGLQVRYKAALDDVHDMRKRLEGLKPRQGSLKADTVLFKALHASIATQIQTVVGTTPTLPPLDHVASMRQKRNTEFLAEETQAEGSENKTVFEAWENQRWVPIRGFQPTIWLGSVSFGTIQFDPAPFNTAFRYGEKEIEKNSWLQNVVSLNYHKEYRRQRLRGFKSLDDVTPFAGTELAENSEWQVVLPENSDEDGWSYAVLFGPRVEWSQEYSRLHHFVRRRLWIHPVQFQRDVPSTSRSSSRAQSSGGPSPNMPSPGKRWVHDDDVSACMRCRKTKFGLLARRHHCRTCGFVVCDNCSRGRTYCESTDSMERSCDICKEAAAQAKREEASRLSAEDGAGGRSEVFAVFQNQRSDLVRWNPTGPPERDPYTEVISGRGYRFLEAVKPPEGFEWFSTDWFVDSSGHVDPDGWQYAGAAWDKNIMPFSAKYNRLLHHTRRRKMIRRIRRVIVGLSLAELRPADVNLHNAPPEVLVLAQENWQKFESLFESLRQSKREAQNATTKAAAKEALASTRATIRKELQNHQGDIRKEFDSASGSARQKLKEELIVAKLTHQLFKAYCLTHFKKQGNTGESVEQW